MNKVSTAENANVPLCIRPNVLKARDLLDEPNESLLMCRWGSQVEESTKLQDSQGWKVI